MLGHTSFFSNVKHTWNQYSPLRSKYSDSVPIPQRSYFTPIYSIDEFANLVVRPISCPLWFGVNALMFFLKSILCLAATLLLVVPTLLCAIFAPNSDLSNNTSAAFKQVAAHTLVAATMTVIATCATFASIVFNTICLLTRGVCTAIDRLNDITESTLGLTIARF